MNLFLYGSAKYLKFIPLNFLITLTGQPVVIPVYHLVSDADVIHVKHLYRIKKVKEFEKDLDFYLKYFAPLSAMDMIDSLNRGSRINKKSFILTFDDGLREFHDIIAPILLRKGIPATCFLNSAFIGSKDLFYRYQASILTEAIQKQNLTKRLKKEIDTWTGVRKIHWDENGQFVLNINYLNRHLLHEIAAITGTSFREYLNTHEPYMNHEHINTLIKQGFTFGAHGIDHADYSCLNVEEQLFQTMKSIREITDTFHLNYKLFAFPFTDFGISKKFFNTIFSDNQQIAELSFGTAGLKNDSCPRNIQRIPMEIMDFSAEEITRGEYFYYVCKAFVRKNTINR